MCIKSGQLVSNACIMVAISRAVDKWPRSVSPCGFWNVDLVIPNSLAVLFILFAKGASEPKVPDTVGCAKVCFDHSARSGRPGLGSRPIILVAALRTAYRFLFTTFKALLSSYGIKESSFRAIICEKCNPAFACSALQASRTYSFC